MKEIKIKIYELSDLKKSGFEIYSAFQEES